MRAVVQRVRRADVMVDGDCVAAIRKGLLVLVGIEEDDSEQDTGYIVRKCMGLRIFEDEDGNMNRSVEDVDGEILLVSQFTLLGDARKGRRPSFSHAMPPHTASFFFEGVVLAFQKAWPKVQTGQFGAHMRVGLENDGPVTILLDSRRTF